VCDLETSRIGDPYIYIYDISSLRVNGHTTPDRSVFEKRFFARQFVDWKYISYLDTSSYVQRLISNSEYLNA